MQKKSVVDKTPFSDEVTKVERIVKIKSSRPGYYSGLKFKQELEVSRWNS